MARPSSYKSNQAETILSLLCEGRTLREICRTNEKLPGESTVRLWVMDDREGFAARYERARKVGYMSKFDEILEIAEDGSNDWMERRDDKGGTSYVLNGEHVQRSRLRVETLKWALSKALPKLFGDKLQHTGDGDDPITVVVRKFTDA